ncbi:MAG: hypothetical protein DHS20C18_24220 [Saprospiraceae bacterium]|nr:MAG: hypothetical protein DHS20C18_24220 [Saprospiraceae bacterium]
MKSAIFYFLILLLNIPLSAQSMQQATLPPEAYQLYPTLNEMYGFAVGKFNHTLLIIGGRIKNDVPAQQGEDFPNTDILLIDFQKKRASAFTSGGLEGILGEQMAATGFGYYQIENTLYISGGYGYSYNNGKFFTFPYLTAVDLPGAIGALLNGESPAKHFYQICDDRIALFDTELDHNGDEFFLINGKQAFKLDPFEDRAEYVETDFYGETRTFRVLGDLENLEIADFKEWYSPEALQHFYGDLLPPKVKRAIIEWGANPKQL